MKNVLTRLALAVALCPPLATIAQPARLPPASAPPLQYRSAFEGYKPYEDTKTGDWRALNDTVKEGDSMADMRAMGAMPGHAMPMPAASAPSHAGHAKAMGKAASMPGMADHAGHRMPGATP